MNIPKNDCRPIKIEMPLEVFPWFKKINKKIELLTMNNDIRDSFIRT